MIRETLAHLILALTVALLPLYIRFGEFDASRSVRDNLAITVLGLVCVLLSERQRSVPKIVWAALGGCLFFLIANQWNVISINVVIQQIYITAYACFAVKFYECFDRNKIHYILNAMAIGCILQSLLAIGDYFNVLLYGEFFKWLLDIKWTAHIGGGIGSGNGSLLNPNILASYLALTGMTLFRPKWRYFIPLVIAGLVTSGSLMGIFAFIGGAAYLLNQKYKVVSKKLFYASGVAVMAIVWIGGGFGLDSGRARLWNRSVAVVRGVNTIIGKGPGWFPDARIIADKFQEVALENAYYAAIDFDSFLKGRPYQFKKPLFGYDATMLLQEHNEYLAVFNLFGLAGILTLFLLFKNFFNCPDSGLWPSILFVAFLNSYGHFSMHISVTAIIIVITACICMAKGEEHVWHSHRL